MRFRIRPVDTSFYDLFAESANHLVGGVSLLAEMLSDSADREDVARRMRDAEHAAEPCGASSASRKSVIPRW